jgi:hypothetical protein
MAPRPHPSECADSDIRNGRKGYHIIARKILLILVHKAGHGPISFSDLPKEIGVHPHRSFTWPLASIGRAIQKLNEEKEFNAPRIQFLVHFKGCKRSPLEGSTYFTSGKEKIITRSIIEQECVKIKEYEHWDRFLMEIL